MPIKPGMPRPCKEVDVSTYSGRFAVRLKTLREKAGLTHEDVAEALGVDPRTIYRWESAKTDPQIKQLPILAEIFCVEVRTLFPKK